MTEASIDDPYGVAFGSQRNKARPYGNALVNCPKALLNFILLLVVAYPARPCNEPCSIFVKKPKQALGSHDYLSVFITTGLHGNAMTINSYLHFQSSSKGCAVKMLTNQVNLEGVLVNFFQLSEQEELNLDRQFTELLHRQQAFNDPNRGICYFTLLIGVYGHLYLTLNKRIHLFLTLFRHVTKGNKIKT